MRIAIVGGSLGGAFLALQLRESGHQIWIFDPRAPWEKPCGGGVYADVLRQFPILGELPCAWHRPDKLRLISSNGEATILLENESAWPIVSRYDLNRGILDLARQTGTARLIPERVYDINLTPHGSNWLALTSSHSYESDIIIGADGARSVVRRCLMGDIPREHLAVTVGYTVTNVPLYEVVVRTYRDLVGYLWCFPRSDHANLGIGARLGTASVSELWQRLETFLGKYYPQARKKKRWAALLPSVSKPDFWRQPCAGDNWALIGDAAGQVDCMIGAGIPYALASANLVAQAILRDDLKSYDRTWRGEFGNLLERSSTIMSQIVRSGDTASFERAVVHLLGGNTAFTKPGLQPAI